MEKFRIIGSALFLLFTQSCQKEFTVTTEKEEAYAVYSFLNLKDTANYVRINRIFIAQDDPGQYIQDPDSVNIWADDFEVTLRPYFEGQPESIILLHPSDDFVKNDGLFATGHYQSFKTNQQLQPDRKYVLTVKNILTGYEMHAETDLLGRRTVEYSFYETRYININQYDPELIDYQGDISPGQWDKIIHRFLYYEYKDDEVRMKYVDYRPALKTGTAEDRNTAELQLSDDFLNYLAEEIKEDPSVRRKAAGVDKMLLLNDEELEIFIDYSADQSSGHYIPVYTNFDKGTGMLASRYYYTYFAMKLKRETIDSLAYGRPTRNLRFADSNGNWSP